MRDRRKSAILNRRIENDEKEAEYQRMMDERIKKVGSDIQAENLVTKRLTGGESKRGYVPQIRSLRHAGQAPDSSSGWD